MAGYKKGQYSCDRCGDYVWHVMPVYMMQTVDEHAHSETYEGIEESGLEPQQIVMHWCIECVRGKAILDLMNPNIMK